MANTTARPENVAALKELTAEQPSPMVPDEPVVGTPANPDTGTAKAAQAAQVSNISRIDKMRQHFLKQPKRRVKVRNDGPVRVQVNGYSFLIQPNVVVEVPEQVAQLLEEADYI